MVKIDISHKSHRERTVSLLHEPTDATGNEMEFVNDIEKSLIKGLKSVRSVQGTAIRYIRGTPCRVNSDADFLDQFFLKDLDG